MIEIKGEGIDGQRLARSLLALQRGAEAASAGAAAAGGTDALGVLLSTLLPVRSLLGVSVSGRVARCAAAGPVGKNSGPR
ncbi:hypothetical protein ASF16_17985 [Acidovorax sp. Leaf78]|nr:hypothetical protein ASF16_17985 [Acidovorax sp. Leaf78]